MDPIKGKQNTKPTTMSSQDARNSKLDGEGREETTKGQAATTTTTTTCASPENESSATEEKEKAQTPCSPRTGRSVNDYASPDDLRTALSYCSLADEKQQQKQSQQSDQPGNSDWKLPVEDNDALEQEIDSEVQRLWTLKSYLVLDAEKEEAFDKLCEEAREVFQVPVSAISLVDLGRQFAFASAGVSPKESRNTPRKVAFCAHTILNKKEVMVVPDTWDDSRFRENKLVTHPPFLRFYAGASLVSPEGYNLGTFCVEGPDPKPEGLSAEQIKRLSDFATRTVELLVKRRDKLRKRAGAASPTNAAADDGLRHHAGVATNLGGLLYNVGEYVTAMKLFQESVQTLMLLEEGAPGQRPSKERQEEMAHLLAMLGAEANTPESIKAFINLTKKLTGTQSEAPPEESEGPHTPVRVITGLYGHDTNLKGMERCELAGLVFAEPFRITVNEETDTCEHFIIPVHECSKATLFNMGLIHYQWGNSNTAMQFFDLASSLSRQSSPLAFDPVILGSFNNMAQIHLQYRRTGDAMELLKDALARGNAALAAVYGEDKSDWRSQEQENIRASRRSRRLRRKLARTVLNLGHVHFINSEYALAMSTCHDALRLLHTNNTEEPEVAAVYHNIGVIQYHRGNKLEALVSLDKFVVNAKPIIGSDHLQIAEAMHQKGVILFEMGQLYDSMKPLNEALRIRRLRLGKNHASVAESLCYIGKVLVSREEYDFGLNAYIEGVSVYRSLAGAEGLSFGVAQNLLDVGRAFQIQGQLKQAILAYEEVTGLTKKFFGARHPFVARLNNIVGNLYLEDSNIVEAVKKFDDSVRILTENDVPFNLNFVQDPLCRVHISHHPVAPTA